jgi:hypothetical protein
VRFAALLRPFGGAFFYRVSFHSGGQVWALSALLTTPMPTI